MHEIFGVPGDFALPLFDAIESSALLPLYTLSHEPSAAFAADAAARLRCAPGAVAVTYGAGALNIVNAVAAAYAEKSPVVVLSGAPGKGQRESGLLLHHQARTLDSQMAIYREITCDQVRLDDAGRAATDIARALASARRLSRPVYIELPHDMAMVPCAPVRAAKEPEVDAQVVDACARHILERLAAARHPVLMIGVEVRRFGLEAAVAALARDLAIPVVTSFMGRGLLAHSPLAVSGTYLGAAGDPTVSAMVEDSDGLLLLGVIVCDTNFGVSAKRIASRGAIQAFDRQVTLAQQVWFEVPLPDLVAALRRHARPLNPGARIPAARALPRRLPVDEQPIAPGDVAAGLNDMMERHGRFPIAGDVGDCLFIAMDLLPTDYVAPGYYATMGFGVPAALGVQAATGRRPVALVGDGAFQMTGWELGHCRRHGWDPIVVVLNNGEWGMVSAFRPKAGYTDLGDWDFARCADALGGKGQRVATRSELGRALDAAARDRGRFRLIDVRLASHALSPALTRFAAAHTK